MSAVADPILAFDAETHSYSAGGRRLPSVTEVINHVLPGWQADDWYLQRGTAIHHGCRLFDENKLDWTTVDEQIVGQVKAWAKFRTDFRADVVAVEHPLHHLTYGFAGTLDRVLLDEIIVPPQLVLVDLKSSIAKQVALQLGAYKLLWDSAMPARRIRRGVAVELRDDGTYGTLWLTERELEAASRTFLACLTVYGFMQKENIKAPKEKPCLI